MVRLLGTEFVPKADFSEANVTFYVPVGSSLQVTEAKARATAALDVIDWPGGFHRTDIGWREIKREQGH